MKKYPKDFILKFVQRYTNTSADYIMADIEKFEDEYYKVFPDNFPLERLIDEVCREFEISVDEFNSNFRYGDLPRARWIVIKILQLYGAGNGEISKMTGFSPSRINKSIKGADDFLLKSKYNIVRIVESVKYEPETIDRK
jgi:hypothetical protein